MRMCVIADWRITLANTKAIMEALKGEPAQLIFWATQFRADDVIAAKQLADEAGCYFENILLSTERNPGHDCPNR